VNKIKHIFYILPYLLLSSIYASSSDLAEEGCRYHGHLNVNLMYQDHTEQKDFFTDHLSMARVMQSDQDDGQYSSMIRFRPVKFINGKIVVGESVLIPSIDIISSFQNHGARLPENIMEIGFASGIYNPASKDLSMIPSTVVDIQVDSHRKKSKILSLRPAAHKSGKISAVPNLYPIRFLMFNYVDPGLLEKQLKQRYFQITESIINKGNIKALQSPHEETLNSLELRKKLLLKIVEEMNEDATDVVMEKYKKAFEETKTPNTNSRTNSYNCAEQAQFVYLSDIRIISYLRKKIGVEEEGFIGMIANAHCSHTPCHSCATTFTRESETGGILSVIANGFPVYVLCSCQNHYKRPDTKEARMLKYAETLFYENLMMKKENDPIFFSFNRKDAPVPYPIVLLKHDPSSEDYPFSVDIEHYKQLVDGR